MLTVSLRYIISFELFVFQIVEIATIGSVLFDKVRVDDVNFRKFISENDTQGYR